MSSNSWLLAVVSCVCLSACFYVRVQCRREGVKSIQNTVVCRSERGSGDRLLHMVVCSSVVTTGQINPFRPKPRHSASESLYDLVSRLLADRTFLGGDFTVSQTRSRRPCVYVCVCVFVALSPLLCFHSRAECSPSPKSIRYKFRSGFEVKCLCFVTSVDKYLD